MTIYRVIWGTAKQIAPGSMSVEEEHDIVRIYRSGGDEFVGLSTTDIDYFCSQRCLDAAGYELGGNSVVVGKLLGHHEFITADVQMVFDDWPSYDVYCTSCQDLIHPGTEDTL